MSKQWGPFYFFKRYKTLPPLLKKDSCISTSTSSGFCHRHSHASLKKAFGMAQYGLHHFCMKHVDDLVWEALTCGRKYRHAALCIHKFIIFLDMRSFFLFYYELLIFESYISYFPILVVQLCLNSYSSFTFQGVPFRTSHNITFKYFALCTLNQCEIKWKSVKW